jgi:DNA transformation protein and related proteins
MTATTSTYLDFVLEQLAPLSNVSSGRFFGGVGLSSSGTQFAMIMGNSLYFVVDAVTRAKYQAMGSKHFSYATQKRRVDVHKYYEVPAEVLDDQEQLVALARESVRVAGAGSAKSSAKSPKRKSARKKSSKG